MNLLKRRLATEARIFNLFNNPRFSNVRCEYFMKELPQKTQKKRFIGESLVLAYKTFNHGLMTEIKNSVPSVAKSPKTKKASLSTCFWVEYGARTHDLLNHNQAL